jgi:hypothetical protein
MLDYCHAIDNISPFPYFRLIDRRAKQTILVSEVQNKEVNQRLGTARFVPSCDNTLLHLHLWEVKGHSDSLK